MDIAGDLVQEIQSNHQQIYVPRWWHTWLITPRRSSVWIKGDCFMTLDVEHYMSGSMWLLEGCVLKPTHDMKKRQPCTYYMIHIVKCMERLDLVNITEMMHFNHHRYIKINPVNTVFYRLSKCIFFLSRCIHAAMIRSAAWEATATALNRRLHAASPAAGGRSAAIEMPCAVLGIAAVTVSTWHASTISVHVSFTYSMTAGYES